MTKRVTNGELQYIIRSIEEAIGNYLSYYVMALLCIGILVITEPAWIDRQGMNCIIVLFACIAVLPEIE